MLVYSGCAIYPRQRYNSQEDFRSLHVYNHENPRTQIGIGISKWAYIRAHRLHCVSASFFLLDLSTFDLRLSFFFFSQFIDPGWSPTFVLSFIRSF